MQIVFGVMKFVTVISLLFVASVAEIGTQETSKDLPEVSPTVQTAESGSLDQESRPSKSTYYSHHQCRIDVCLVLDGSSNRSMYGWKRLSLLLADFVLKSNKRNRIGAVQFGTISEDLSTLTSNYDQFRGRLWRRPKVGTKRNSNGGFLGCQFMLDGSKEDERVVVLMLSGEANIGGSIEERASDYRENGATVLLITGANANKKWANSISGGVQENLVTEKLFEQKDIYVAFNKVKGRMCQK